MTAHELSVDPSATEDVFVHPSVYPPATFPGDIIAIRPAKLAGKGKARDNPVLYRVPEGAEDDQGRAGRRQALVVIGSNCANSFGLANRTEVLLELIVNPCPPEVTATYVELCFSNIYLSRPDMLRLTLSLCSTIVYHHQRISLAGSSARLYVGGIYNQLGHSTATALIDGDTKIIFRSESARTYVFVEVSAEMWQFEEDGCMLSEKCEVFLRELVSNWQGGGTGGKNGIRKGHTANHMVSVILYGRVIYEDNGEGEEERAPTSRNEEGMIYRDFYKVVLDMSLAPSASIAQKVSQEIDKWQREVLVRTRPDGQEKRAGRIAFAHESNVLEAINLSLNLFEEHWIDRDLQRTGLALLVITAGTTFYHVPKNLLRLTTERMLCHGIGMDLISLSKTPLHTVPLFSFRSQEPTLSQVGSTSRLALGDTLFVGATTRDPRSPLPEDQRTPLYYDSPSSSPATSIYYSEPLFIFCSFFGFQSDKPHRIDRFMPRARCYELLSQGVGERIPISIELLPGLVEMQKDPEEEEWKYLTEAEKRQKRRERYDAHAVGAKVGVNTVVWNPQSGTSGGDISGTSLPLVAPKPVVRIMVEQREQTLGHSRQRSSDGSLGVAAKGRAVSAAVLGTPAAAEPERGRERRASDAHRIPSSTRSRTPRGVRAPSISSIKTVSSRNSRPTPKTLSMPSLISRLTGATSTGSSSGTVTTATSSARPSWLGMFRGVASSSSAPATNTTTVSATSVAGAGMQPPSIGVQRVAAQGNSKPSLDLDTISLEPSRPSSVTSPSTTSSRRSSNTIATRMAIAAPTRPISIGTRAVGNTREVARSLKSPNEGGPSSLSATQYAPVEEAAREESNTSSRIKKREFGKLFNPSKPRRKGKLNEPEDNERRWASLYIRHSNDQRAVNWVSMCTPACLPLTSDYLPTTEMLSRLYTDNRYSIPSTATQGSMLLRHNDDSIRTITADLIQELISQRLSHGFQICLLPSSATGDAHAPEMSKAISDILHEMEEGEATGIYLSLSNQIHRISYERRTQSVVVKISRKRRTWIKKDMEYSALIWTDDSLNSSIGFEQTSTVFPYTTLIEPTDWEHLDRLVAGVERMDLRDSLRYWRTRLVLLPQEEIPDREFLLANNNRRLEAKCTDQEIRLKGFEGLMEMLQAARWSPPGGEKENTVTEITSLSPAAWARKVAKDAAQAATDSAAAVQRPSRWLRRAVVHTAKEDLTNLLGMERERTLSPDRKRALSPERTRTISPSRRDDPVSPLVPKRPIVEMSHSLILDLDLQKKSDRVERVLCHIDRSHNVSAAYHMELNWLAGSGKIIDASIQSWARYVSKYGLRLVEVSTRGSVEDRHNPFQNATRIRIAIPPPSDPEDYFESQLLRMMNFFLDIGSEKTFPPEIETVYSYRRVHMRHSQYIHQSGMALISILGGEPGFAFSPNRIFISHSTKRPAEVARELKALCEEVATVCGDIHRLRTLWDVISRERKASKQTQRRRN